MTGQYFIKVYGKTEFQKKLIFIAKRTLETHAQFFFSHYTFYMNFLKISHICQGGAGEEQMRRPCISHMLSPGRKVFACGVLLLLLNCKLFQEPCCLFSLLPRGSVIISRDGFQSMCPTITNSLTTSLPYFPSVLTRPCGYEKTLSCSQQQIFYQLSEQTQDGMQF